MGDFGVELVRAAHDSTSVFSTLSRDCIDMIMMLRPKMVPVELAAKLAMEIRQIGCGQSLNSEHRDIETLKVLDRPEYREIFRATFDGDMETDFSYAWLFTMLGDTPERRAQCVAWHGEEMLQKVLTFDWDL